MENYFFLFLKQNMLWMFKITKNLFDLIGMKIILHKKLLSGPTFILANTALSPASH